MRGVDKPAEGGVVLHAYVGAARCEEDHRNLLGQCGPHPLGRRLLQAPFMGGAVPPIENGEA